MLTKVKCVLEVAQLPIYSQSLSHRCQAIRYDGPFVRGTEEESLGVPTFPRASRNGVIVRRPFARQ